MVKQKRERVVKGYYVVAVLDDDGFEKPHQVSRVYQSLQAAQELAEVYRAQVSRPQFVNVATRYGYDDAAGICCAAT